MLWCDVLCEYKNKHFKKPNQRKIYTWNSIIPFENISFCVFLARVHNSDERLDYDWSGEITQKINLMKIELS